MTIDPSRPEVIAAHTLNFRPKFKLLHFGGGVDPVLIVVCANKSWSISNACKNLRGQQPLRAECSLLQNVHVGGSVCTSRTFLFVDQSSPNFFPPTWKGLRLIEFFQMFDV